MYITVRLVWTVVFNRVPKQKKFLDLTKKKKVQKYSCFCWVRTLCTYIAGKGIVMIWPFTATAQENVYFLFKKKKKKTKT